MRTQTRSVRPTSGGARPHLPRPSAAGALTAVPAALVVLVGAVLTCSYSVAQWRGFQVPSWDLAIFSEAVKAYAHGQTPIVPVKGPGFNLLGDHFHPILVLAAPLWWLWPSPLMLLVLQDLLLAVSAWPLTRLAARVVGPVAGTALGLAYVLSWGLQGAVGAQFHEIAFAVPMLAWAGVAFVERRWVACAAWLAPLVLVKEDLGLTVLMGGLAIAWRAWTGQRSRTLTTPRTGEEAVPSSPTSPATPAPRLGPVRLTAVQLGLAVAAWGVGWFLLTVLVVLPALSSTGSWQYGLGGNAGDGSAPSTQAGSLLERLLVPEVKRRTLALVAASAGVVGLASPWAALVLPTLAWRFLSGKEAYWDWQLWHYNAVLMPVLLAALLDVLMRLRAQRSLAAAGVPSATSTAVPYGRLASTGVDAPAPATWIERLTGGWTGVPRWAAALAVVGLVVPCLTAWRAAPQLQVTGTDPYQPLSAARTAAADGAVRAVPEGATVETDLTLLAALVPQATVYWVGTSAGTPVDYVAVDTASGAWGGNPPQDVAAWAAARQGGTFQVVYAKEGFEVVRRVR